MAARGTKQHAMRVTRGEWQGSSAAGTYGGDCVQHQSEAEDTGGVLTSLIKQCQV